jgi:hypothetical protein
MSYNIIIILQSVGCIRRRLTNRRRLIVVSMPTRNATEPGTLIRANSKLPSDVTLNTNCTYTRLPADLADREREALSRIWYGFFSVVFGASAIGEGKELREEHGSEPEPWHV